MTPAVSSPMAGGVTPIARRGFTQCARVMCASRGAALVPWRCLSRPFETTRPSSAVHPRLRTSSPSAGIAGYTLVSRIFDPTTWLDRLATYHSARGVTTCAASSSAAGGTRGSVTHQLAAADAIASDTNDVDDPQSSIYPWYQRSFWVSQVTGPAVKQSARLMASRLDFDDPLGIDLTLRGASSSAATTSTETETEKGPPLKKKTTTKRKTLYDYALDVKRQHPKKVLLIRVGEFYEAIGFDAVILVMHAGLNPMGTTGVPKAGCPLVNVQETLDRLTSKGHNVVVCEEVPSMNTYGQRPSPKERYVASIVTPASPQYVVGAAANGDDVAFDGHAPPPVVAVAATAIGYTLVSVECDLRRVTVLQGLTAESAAARLASAGHAPPLFRHDSLDAGFGALGAAARGISGQTRRLRMEIGAILAAAVEASGRDGDNTNGASSSAHQRYDSKDPVSGVLDIVRREYNLAPDTKFEIVKVDGGPGSQPPSLHRPYPLSLATAQQLGALPSRSVPPLLQHLLPASINAPAACRAYIQELLLHPPPRDTARAISRACVLLTSLAPSDGGVPRLEVTPPGKIAKLLRTREGSHVFFAELVAMVRAVRSTLEHDSQTVRAAGEALLNPTSLKVGRPVDLVSLIESCVLTEKIVAGVIAAEVLELPVTEAALVELTEQIRDEDSDENDEKDLFDDGDELSRYSETPDAPPRVPHVPFRFLRLNEPWRGRVRREVLLRQLTSVEMAALAVSNAIEEDLLPLLLQANETGPKSKVKTFLEHDQRNNVLWVRGLSLGVAKTAIESGVPLIHPVDRWGKEIPDRWSTQRVEQAVNAYRVACAECGAQVANELKLLADSLSGLTSDLVAAATFSAIATAVSLHAQHAFSKQWHPAELLPPGDVTTPWTSQGLTPFWMPRGGVGGPTVANDVTVDGLTILTGPNMAGKSTVLRATAVCALLSSCGLFVPCTKAVVPHFDSLIVRMSSTDSPREGLSSYAVEMGEVSTMLEIATARSLVFIDELGRGTEANHGTAMSGAVVEALDRKGTRGIFATHLHGLLDLDLETSPYVRRMKMQTVADDNGKRLTPTWRVVKGECRQSLALQTAVDMGVSESVVLRGHALLSQVLFNEASKVLVVDNGEGRDVQNVSPPSSAPPLKQLAAYLTQEFHDLDNTRGDCDTVTTKTEVGFIAHTQTPPPAATAWTVVYVLRRGDGRAYVGESDDLFSRLERHRQSAKKEALATNNPRASKVECAFVRVKKEQGGKSAARLLEARVIRKLVGDDVPLISGSDARNTRFGSAGGGA